MGHLDFVEQKVHGLERHVDDMQEVMLKEMGDIQANIWDIWSLFCIIMDELQS